jgi:hypothetical protein
MAVLVNLLINSTPILEFIGLLISKLTIATR